MPTTFVFVELEGRLVAVRTTPASFEAATFTERTIMTDGAITYAASERMDSTGTSLFGTGCW